MILTINEEIALEKRMRYNYVNIKHICNEGFFDAIKSAGAGIYRFIRNLIRKVIDFIKSILGFFTSKKSKLRRLSRTLEKLTRDHRREIDSNPDRFSMGSIEVIKNADQNFIKDKIDQKIDLTDELMEEVKKAFAKENYITELNPRETFVSLFSILKEIENAMQNRSTVSGLAFLNYSDLLLLEIKVVLTNGDLIEANQKKSDKALYEIEKNLQNNSSKSVQRSLIDILKNFNEYLMEEKETFNQLYEYYIDVTKDMIDVIKDNI